MSNEAKLTITDDMITNLYSLTITRCNPVGLHR